MPITEQETYLSSWGRSINSSPRHQPGMPEGCPEKTNSPLKRNQTTYIQGPELRHRFPYIPHQKSIKALPTFPQIPV